jgi:gliding motility-associated-like protein
MNKVLLITLSCCLIYQLAAGYHIIGGEIYYKTIGITSTGSYRYLITLKLYRDADFTCGERQGCLDRFENPIPISIYTAAGIRVGAPVMLSIGYTIPLRDTLKNPCLAPQTQHLEVAFYETEIELPPITNGYFVAYQRCCRGEKLTNIYNSEQEGSTFFTRIPGLESRPNNSSAYFNKDAAIVICSDMPFKYDYAAFDPDGDSLTYHLCSALTGGTSRNESNLNTPPPYNNTVNYIPPYSGDNPMGGRPQISISPTGMIAGTPDRPGKYVVTVCVNEYDRITKQFIGTHSKDILLTVFNCKTAIKANFPSVLNNCTESEALDVAIPNYSNAGFTSAYYWTFGDGTDTVTYERTVFNHQYPDTGRYEVKLVVNPTLPCKDSATGVVQNYPGLRVGFVTTGLCKGLPIHFEDTSSYKYGLITKRQWNLGVIADSTFRPTARNLDYVYSKGDIYTVTLSLETDKACTKSVTQNIRISEVNAFAGNDTILSRGQLLPLHAQGGDYYTWWPPDGLSNTGIADPVVNWRQDIQYALKVTNQEGCVGNDSIRIKYYDGPEMYIPNAFSPNGDGINDYFRFIPVGIIEYRYFRIFNRWGQEVYSSTNFRIGWDGTLNGQPAPVDTYIWILEGKDLNGQMISRKGSVTLLR